MKTKAPFLTLAITLILAAMIAVAPAVAQKPQEVLQPGEYTAGIKAITCGGCGPLIKKTMEGMKEIASVSVDNGKKTVLFAVKKDVTLKVADLQKALDAAAKIMGMGADYTMLDLKATK